MVVNRADERADAPTDKLVIYLQGGGACWDDLTCSNGTAVYTNERLTDYDVRLDANEMSQSGIGDRTNLDNPFRNDSFAYIPYCTGDIHSGGQTAENPDTKVLHRGGLNLQEFVSSSNGLVDQFPDVSEVFLIGASAGGFGATVMYQTVAEAFGDVPVHLLSDGGIPLGDIELKANPDQPFETERSMPEFQRFLIEDAWNVTPFLPDNDAGAPIKAFDLIFADNNNDYTERRFGVITSLDDKVIQQFIHTGIYGLYYTVIHFESNPQYTQTEWQSAVGDMETLLSAYPNSHAFIKDDSTHVYIGDNLLTLVTAGATTTTLAEWLDAFRSGDNWTTVSELP